MNFVKNVKSCTNKLQADYLNSLIDYPRIENGYISKTQTFEFFPHKPFDSNISKEYATIKSKTLPLNKKNSLLFLSNERLIMPSQTVNFAKVIDNFLDDDLKFKDKRKEQEFEQILEILNNFLKNRLETDEKEKQEKAVIDKQRNFYHTFSPLLFYKAPRYCFVRNISLGFKSKRARSPQEILNIYYDKLKDEEKQKKKKDEFYRTKRSIRECLQDFLLESPNMKNKVQNEQDKFSMQNQAMANFLNNLE